jgi:hypothetical protein
VNVLRRACVVQSDAHASRRREAVSHTRLSPFLRTLSGRRMWPAAALLARVRVTPLARARAFLTDNIDRRAGGPQHRRRALLRKDGDR